MAIRTKYDLDLIDPERFGNGATMTVYVYNGDYGECSNSLIDIEQTVARLKSRRAT